MFFFSFLISIYVMDRRVAYQVRILHKTQADETDEMCSASRGLPSRPTDLRRRKKKYRFESVQAAISMHEGPSTGENIAPILLFFFSTPLTPQEASSVALVWTREESCIPIRQPTCPIQQTSLPVSDLRLWHPKRAVVNAVEIR